MKYLTAIAITAIIFASSAQVTLAGKEDKTTIGPVEHGIPHAIFFAVRAKCGNDWPGDYQMQLFCENQQFEAYTKLMERAPLHPGEKL